MATGGPVQCACTKNACTRVRGREGDKTRGYCPCRENGTACTYLCRCGNGRYSCMNRDYVEEDPEEFIDDDLHDPLYDGDAHEGEMLSVYRGGEDAHIDVADTLNTILQTLAVEQAELNTSLTMGDMDEAPAKPKRRKKATKTKTQTDSKSQQKSATEGQTPAQLRTAKKKAAAAQRRAEVHRVTVRVNQLTTDGRQTLTLKLVELYPDLVDMAMGPDPPNPPPNTPPNGWCKCGNCRQMPTVIERVCCLPAEHDPCMLIKEAGPINQLVLSRTALRVAVLNHNEYCIQEDDPDNNDTLRHMAYRKFILWKRGYLGAGIRVVIPSCMVWAIRSKYPSADGTYTGYKPYVG